MADGIFSALTGQKRKKQPRGGLGGKAKTPRRSNVQRGSAALTIPTLTQRGPRPGERGGPLAPTPAAPITTGMGQAIFGASLGSGGAGPIRTDDLRGIADDMRVPRNETNRHLDQLSPEMQDVMIANPITAGLQPTSKPRLDPLGTPYNTGYRGPNPVAANNPWQPDVSAPPAMDAKYSALAAQKAEAEAQNESLRAAMMGGGAPAFGTRGGTIGNTFKGTAEDYIGLSQKARAAGLAGDNEGYRFNNPGTWDARDKAKRSQPVRSTTEVLNDTSVPPTAWGLQRMYGAQGRPVPTSLGQTVSDRMAALRPTYAPMDARRLMVTAKAQGAPLSEGSARYAAIANRGGAPTLSQAIMGIGPPAAIAADPELSRNRLMATMFGPGGVGSGDGDGGGGWTPRDVRGFIGSQRGGQRGGGGAPSDVSLWPSATNATEALRVIESQGLDLNDPAQLEVAKRYLREHGIPASEMAEVIDETSGRSFWSDMWGSTPESRGDVFGMPNPNRLWSALLGTGDTPVTSAARQTRNKQAKRLAGF